MVGDRTSLLLVDLDNTLYDWVGFFAPAMQAMITELCAATGADPANVHDELRAVFTRHRSIEYAFCVQATPMVADMAVTHRRAVVERCRHAFRQARDEHLTLYPGVAETLRELDQGGLTIVATTNAPLYHAVRRLQRLDIAQYFDAIAGRRSFEVPDDPCVTRDVVHRRQMAESGGRFWSFDIKDLKPSARMYDAALRSTGIAAANALAVGDHPVNDLAPARHLGIRGAWARYGRHIDRDLWLSLLDVTPWTRVDVASQAAPPESSAAALDRFSDVLNLV